MYRVFRFGLLLILVCGCQYSRCSDRYHAGVDDLSDRDVYLDRFYYAPMDATRIGRADWYQSRMNRTLFGRRRACCP